MDNEHTTITGRQATPRRPEQISSHLIKGPLFTFWVPVSNDVFGCGSFEAAYQSEDD